jgi:ubiquinone/menaquinone biosynthesis C-methylase UbiE
VTDRRRKVWWWLAGAALGVGLLVWLRRRVSKETIQRRFWDPVYDRLAQVYDAIDWLTGGVAHRLRRRALRYLPPEGSRVLEVGFGGGRLQVEMARRWRSAGIDLAPGMAQLARRRLSDRALSSHLAVGNVMALPWADASFDAVVSTFAFSAFPDGEGALTEMTRVVKKGGRVIIVDAGQSHDGNLMARLLAGAWSLVGDYMRDEGPLMEGQGLVGVTREEYGPWNHIHAVVGIRPPLPAGET